jgi:hypothetical protein
LFEQKKNKQPLHQQTLLFPKSEKENNNFYDPKQKCFKNIQQPLPKVFFFLKKKKRKTFLKNIHFQFTNSEIKDQRYLPKKKTTKKQTKPNKNKT